MVLICISLMIRDVEHLFMSYSPLCVIFGKMSDLRLRFFNHIYMYIRIYVHTHTNISISGTELHEFLRILVITPLSDYDLRIVPHLRKAAFSFR